MLDGFILPFLLLIILALAGLVFIIFTLVHQAKHKKWLWFWITLLLTLLAGVGVFTSIIYWIVVTVSKPRRSHGKKKKKKR